MSYPAAQSREKPVGQFTHELQRSAPFFFFFILPFIKLGRGAVGHGWQEEEHRCERWRRPLCRATVCESSGSFMTGSRQENNLIDVARNIQLHCLFFICRGLAMALELMHVVLLGGGKAGLEIVRSPCLAMSPCRHVQLFTCTGSRLDHFQQSCFGKNQTLSSFSERSSSPHEKPWLLVRLLYLEPGKRNSRLA